MKEGSELDAEKFFKFEFRLITVKRIYFLLFPQVGITV